MRAGKLPAGRATETALGLGTLLLAAGTLLCCALPLFLVSIGLGASVAALTSAAPWLVSLSHYKFWMFAGSAVALAGAAWLMFRPGRACPADPQLAGQCMRLDRWNRRILVLAAAIWCAGVAAAYLWLPAQRWMDP